MNPRPTFTLTTQTDCQVSVPVLLGETCGGEWSTYTRVELRDGVDVAAGDFQPGSFGGTTNIVTGA